MLNLDGITTDQAAIAFLFRRGTKSALALILAALGSSTMPTGADEGPADLVPVPRTHLCVTEGALETLPDGRILIAVAKLRAVLAAPGPQAIEARFTYLGPTAETAPLRSGAVRRQFGLKLRAADGCNLIYAMWRFAPKASLTVSVKSNPLCTKAAPPAPPAITPLNRSARRQSLRRWSERCIAWPRHSTAMRSASSLTAIRFGKVNSARRRLPPKGRPGSDLRMRGSRWSYSPHRIRRMPAQRGDVEDGE